MSAERPKARWCHSRTDLADFALITWAVDPDRVEAQLPAGFAPDVRAGTALVSMVPFLDDGFHFRAAPFARVSCGQVNYRTYVRRGQETGVWFFGTSLDSVFVHLPKVAWKMPWHRTGLRIEAEWNAVGCTSWRAEASGTWGAAAIALAGTGRPFPRPPGFESDDEVSRVLTDPLVGWYGRSDGSGVGRYSVWHEPLGLEEATVVDGARCDVFTALDLVDAGQMPLCAGVQRRVAFDVHTPPTRS